MLWLAVGGGILEEMRQLVSELASDPQVEMRCRPKDVAATARLKMK
jgi:hypothetical protein